MTYEEFLKTKEMAAEACGFDMDRSTITPMAFDYQRDIIAWACKKGKCAILTGCGTGKTLMLLEWSRAVHEHTGRPVLIVSPLSVVEQTRREGVKFGICAVNVCRSGADVRDGVNITNYEMIEHFDASVFAGVVLDESSILKSFTGKYKTLLTDMFCRTPYRLLCTATIAPNDYTEIGTSCEFLGIMSRTEMLAMYFIHDGGETSKWRLKKAGVKKFWEWFATWAIYFNSPVWWDINQSDTLNALAPKDDESERHICPLQLPVIERCLRLYSNEGDVIFTPFLGIGSEVYQAVKMGRRGIGIELKPAYYQAAVQNVKNAENERNQATLFDFI